jgi:hypothetical protein
MAMTYQELTRNRKWGIDFQDPTEIPENKLILSAILRIADNTELMAHNYKALQSDNEQLLKLHIENRKKIKELTDQLNAEKAVKMRYFNKLQEIKIIDNLVKPNLHELSID